MKSHKITEKEARRIVDKWVTLRLDVWRKEMIRQLKGNTITEHNDKLSLTLTLEIDALAVWFAINSKGVF